MLYRVTMLLRASIYIWQVILRISASHIFWIGFPRGMISCQSNTPRQQSYASQDSPAPVSHGHPVPCCALSLPARSRCCFLASWNGNIPHARARNSRWQKQQSCILERPCPDGLVGACHSSGTWDPCWTGTYGQESPVWCLFRVFATCCNGVVLVWVYPSVWMVYPVVFPANYTRVKRRIQKQQKKPGKTSFFLKYFLHFPRKGGYLEEKHEEI